MTGDGVSFRATDTMRHRPGQGGASRNVLLQRSGMMSFMP